MIDTNKALTYFLNVWKAKKTTKGWYNFPCPYCAKNGYKNTIAVNPTFGTMKCWSPSCDFKKGSMERFIMQQENLKNNIEVDKFLLPFENSNYVVFTGNSHKPEFHKSELLLKLPKGYKSLLEGDTLLGKRARQYLISRNFDIKALDLKGFGYCDVKDNDMKKDFFGYIIVPFYANKELVYYLGRDFLNRSSKYKYKNIAYDVFRVEKSEIIYNSDALNKHDTVFLNEGWADAETIGSQGIASLGWNLSPQQRTMIVKSQIKRLVIVADKGAYKEAVKTSLDFIDYKEVYVVSFENCSKKDVNEIGKHEFLLMYESTQRMTKQLAYNILTDNSIINKL